MKFEALATSPLRASPAAPAAVDSVTIYWDSYWFSAARSVLVIALLAAPLAFGAVQPWASAALTGMIVVAMFLWAWGCVRIESIALAWTPLYVPAALFLVLAAAQAFTGRSANPIATRDSIVSYVACCMLFVLAVTLAVRVPPLWSRFGKVVTIYTLLLSLFAILQFFTSPDKVYWTVVPRWGGSIFGPYVNHNHYAGLMEMLIALTATFWLGRRQRDLWNWLAGFATLIALASVALSGSRAGVGAVLLEMVLLGGVALFAQRRGQLNTPVPVLALALLCATLLTAWLAPLETTERFRPSASIQDASFSERVAMAGDSLRMAREHPLVGVGLGSFETAYPPYQSFVEEKRIEHAHNDYAEALAETGIAGGTLILLALGVFFRNAAQNFRSSLASGSDTVTWMRLGATVGCAGLLVHSYFDFNLHIPANAAWFVTLAALAVAPIKPVAPSRTAVPR